MDAAKKVTLPPLYTSLSQIIDDYDGFVLDIWGVLYDGKDLYEGVIDALATMRRAGKRITLLSNSPRRADGVAALSLTPKGLTPDMYDVLISSGEVAHAYMEQNWSGKRIYRFWPEEHGTILETIPHTPALSTAEADVILAALIPHGMAEDAFDDALATAKERGVPMVCANPDLVVNNGASLSVCAGTYAKRYEDMGGTVIWIGKPYPMVYDRALEFLHPTAKHRVLAIGDSLHTDVAGARGAGIDVAWNLPGIHWEEIRAHGPLSQPNPMKLAAALTQAEHAPTALLMGLKP